MRILRTVWEEVPLSAAFFAAFALASCGLAAATVPFSDPASLNEVLSETGSRRMGLGV